MSKEGSPKKFEPKSVSAILHNAGVDSAVAIEYDKMYERFQILRNDAREVKKVTDEAFKLGYAADRIAKGSIHEVVAEIIKRCVILAEYEASFAGEARKIKIMSKNQVTKHAREMVHAHRKFLANAELEGGGDELIIRRLTEWLAERKGPKQP